MKYECPNCKEFQYEKRVSNRGWRLLIGLPIFVLMIHGESGVFGRNIDMGNFAIIVLLSMIIGVITITFSFISFLNKNDYTCSNCRFTQKENIYTTK